MAAAAAGPALAAARPFFETVGLPIGLQLYTLGPDAGKDPAAALKAVSAIGYRAVEMAGLMGLEPGAMRAALDAAGLTCASAHVQLAGDPAKLADELSAIGVKYAVAPSPYIPERLDQKPAPGEKIGDWFLRVVGQLTADDWKRGADFLNARGAALARWSIQVAYHNHNVEFAPVGGTTGLEILLAHTEPKLVTFELDVGWVAAAGADPFAILAKHKGRFRLMHIKDLKADTRPNFALKTDPTEVGSGVLPWPKLLPAGYAAGVRHFYVEQEPPFTRPRIEAARVSYDYLARVVA